MKQGIENVISPRSGVLYSEAEWLHKNLQQLRQGGQMRGVNPNLPSTRYEQDVHNAAGC